MQTMQTIPTVMVGASVKLNETIIGKVTNFDSFTDYQLEAEGLEVKQEEEKLEIIGTKVGPMFFKINGKKYEIEVLKV